MQNLRSGQQSSASKSDFQDLQNLNTDKMLKILESLNINNLIYKFHKI